MRRYLDFYNMLGLYLLISLASLCPLFANDDAAVKFEHLNVQNGLSQSTITFILQDAQGFLWFGTREGVSKYDGYTFLNYKHEPFNKSSLPTNFVDFLFEERNGTLWVVTDGLLNRFDRANNCFERYRSNPDDPNTLSGNNVSIIYEDHDSNLWIGTAGAGLNRYDRDTGQFEHYRWDSRSVDSIGDDYITAIIEDRKGNLWVGTGGGGLNLLDRNSKRFTRFLHKPKRTDSIGSNSITYTKYQRSLLLDDLGVIWVLTEGGGLNRFDPEYGTFVRYVPLPEDPQNEVNSFKDMIEDDAGELWLINGADELVRFNKETGLFDSFKDNPVMKDVVASKVYRDSMDQIWISSQGSGLRRFERESDSFLSFRRDPSDPRSLTTDFIDSIYEDRTGTLWFGSFESGLNKFSRRKQKFRVFPGKMVWTFYEDRDGHFWVGTRTQGLLRVNLEKGDVLESIRYSSQPDKGLTSDNVRAIHQDSDGYLWIGTRALAQQPGGLTRFDPKTKTFKNYLSGREVNNILPNDEDILFLGTYQHGLIRFDKRSGRSTRYSENDPKGPSSNYIYPMVRDRDGHIWMGTQKGINNFDPQTEAFAIHRHDPENVHSLSHNYVMALHLDREGRILAGTLGGGLNISTDSSGKNYRHFTIDQGLPNDVIYGILEDDSGFFWLSTNKGLSRFNPLRETFRNYDLGDGLQSDEFNVGAAFKSKQGELFFGGVNGFNIFYPRELKDNAQPPQLTMSATKNTNMLIAHELQNGATISLSPNDHVIEFTFAALDYTDPAKNIYSFKLEGFDRQWSPPVTRRSATYTSLNPDTYTFKVKAANSDGVWNELGFSQTIVVKPQFYQTWWFTLLWLAGLVCLILLLVSRQRHRWQRQKEEMLIARELEFARQIQLDMLPAHNMHEDQFEIVGRMITADRVGGDYYDYFSFGDRRLCVAFGDATGHGVAAGLVVGMVKMASTVCIKNGETNLSYLIQKLNKGLKACLPARGVGKRMGMGLGFVLIDENTGLVEICANGMPYPYYYRHETRELVPLTLKGLPLGFFPDVEVPIQQLQLDAGDFLVLLSDGFHERFDDRNRLWGEPALANELQNICRDSELADIVADNLIAACHRFAGGRKNEDDMTVVVISWKSAAVNNLDKAVKKPPMRAETKEGMPQ